jgi:hypothetical protein
MKYPLSKGEGLAGFEAAAMRNGCNRRKCHWQGGPAPYIPPCISRGCDFKTCRREIQRLPCLRAAAVSIFPAHYTRRWEGYAYNYPPIGNTDPSSRVVLCVGDQTRGAVWADLDFLAPPFASRQKRGKDRLRRNINNKSLLIRLIQSITIICGPARQKERKDGESRILSPKACFPSPLLNGYFMVT